MRRNIVTKDDLEDLAVIALSGAVLCIVGVIVMAIGIGVVLVVVP